MKQDEIKLREYKLDEGDFYKNGHRMFKEDVLTDLKRLSYLEQERTKSLSKQPSVSDEEAQEWICKELGIDALDFDEKCPLDNGHIVNCFIDFKNILYPQVVQSEVSEIIYLIENDKTEWLVNKNTWTKDANKAFHFNSNNEAVEYIIHSGFGDNVKVTEHIFVNALTPPDAENEAVMFAEWLKKEDWRCVSYKEKLWIQPNKEGTQTTQELFTLYKQGGK